MMRRLPDNMDLMAITMEERVEIDDKYYEIALAPAGSSRTDNVSSDAKVGFLIL
jgi:hypothetical protein